MNIDINDLKVRLERDLQIPFDDVFEWRKKEEKTHSSLYGLEEICDRVQEGTIPFKILWYILRYYSLDEQQITKIIYTLDIDRALYDRKQVYNSYSVIGECEEISSSENIVNSKLVGNSQYVKSSYNVSASKYVNSSGFVSSSKKVTNSFHIFDSSNIDKSSYISASDNINSSQYIKLSTNVWDSRFCLGCENFKNGLFCAFIKNETDKYFIFNKEISKEVFEKIQTDLTDTFGKLFYVTHSPNYYVRARDIEAFKEYCSSIVGYDKVIFDYLMREIFSLWKPIVTGKF